MTAKKINAANYSPPNVNYWGDRCCRAEAALVKAKEKLEAYFKATEGRYPGGPLYSDLMKQIDAVLIGHQQQTGRSEK